MHEADDEFLSIPSGVDKLLLQVLEELESGDRQELGWVWPCLQSSIHSGMSSGMYDHLILQVGGMAQHQKLWDQWHCEKK